MGLLIRLKSPVLEGGTALKSLKYGKDRPGEGDSSQPYVQTPIDQPTSFSDEDTILRGGLKAPSSALKDVSRLTKYFFDNKNPDGLLFIAKQNILSRISTKTEASGIFFNEGIYTPLSTLTQTGVGFAGAHFNKQILGIKKYQDIVFENNKEENNGNDYDNRLLKLWNDSGLNLNGAFPSISPVLYSYGGGPDSILGIGKTNIKFATTNDGVTPSRTNNVPFEDFTRPEVKYSTINIFGDENSSVSLRWASLFPTSEMNLFGSTDYLETYNNTVLDRLGLPSNFATYSGERLKSQGIQVSPYSTWGQTEFQDTLNYQGQNTTNIDDFRTILTSDYTKTFLGTPYTQNNNIETLFNLGNPGQRGNISEIKQGKVINGVSSALDKITSSPIYKTKVINGYSQEPEFDDIIPFVIGILNNEIQDNTAYVKYMHFRAFIDNFSDGYNAEWKGIEYMGRAETFYKYQGFKRDMAVGFTIVAQSRQEQIIMYDKLNFLASSLAPEYLPSGYMTGNLAYLTLGDYISDQPGIINSLDFDISDDSPWETARNIDGSLYNDDVRRLPFMIKVKMKFTPIHKFRPEKETFKPDVDAKGKFVKDSTKLTKMGGQRFIDPNSPIQNPSPSNIVSQTQEDEDIIVTIDIPEDNEIIDIIPEYIEGYGPTI